MVYLLDTNIFITAKNMLPIDIYPSFWNALAQLAEKGVFRSIKKVEDEILKGKDELVDWVKSNLTKDFFIKENAMTLEALSIVAQWAMNNKIYTAAAKNEFMRVADSMIVAEAKSQSYTVVSFETSDPNCKKRVKIPDACAAVGVNCITLNEVFRLLGVSI